MNASLLAPKNYLLRVDFQKLYFSIFLHVQLFVIAILFYLNLICRFIYVLMYLFNFLKSCIAPCNAVNSDCILKVSYFQFVVCLQIPPRVDDIMDKKFD